jgi:hypothetical protein
MFIITSFRGPTNTKGARIKVAFDNGKYVYVNYPYALSGTECHIFAIREAIKKLGLQNDIAQLIVTATDCGAVAIMRKVKDPHFAGGVRVVGTEIDIE